MSFSQAMAIRTAVTELLRGSIGTVRTVPMGLFEIGVHAGQPVSKQQVRAADVRYEHRFDLNVRSLGNHDATPMSVSSAAYRLVKMRFEIPVTTKLKSQVRDDARETVRARIEGDCDTAIQALNYRGNLTATLDGEVTGIISGLMQGPDGLTSPTWELVEENWVELLLRSRIVGEAVVSQTQAVT